MKISQGWIYGEKKDFIKKTHFDLVPFEELTKIEKDKDIIAKTIIIELLF